MRINDKSIKGFFLYSDDVQFEKGDFVVDGGVIYTAKVNVMGKKPSDYNELYDIYLGENIADLEGKDFANYIKGAGSDKLVTAYSVGKILNSFISGFDEKGIINNEITKDQIVYLRDYFGDETVLARTNPLDAVMTAPDLNNCIFKVDRHVVQDLFGTSQLQFTSSYIILRQYTYMEKEASPTGPALYIRVQELIDEETGLAKWRYSTSDDNFDSSIDWNSVNVNENILETIDEIINYYRNKAISFEKEKAAMKASFTFVEVPFSYGAVQGNVLTLNCDDFPGFRVSQNELLANYPVTITVNNQIQGSSVIEAGSSTIDLGRMANIGITNETYRIVNGVNLDIQFNGSVPEFTFTTPTGCLISNIYARVSIEDAYQITSSNSMMIGLNCIDTDEGSNAVYGNTGSRYIIPIGLQSIDRDTLMGGTLVFKGVQSRYYGYDSNGWRVNEDEFQLSIPIKDIFIINDLQVNNQSNSEFINNSGGVADGKMTWVSAINGLNRFNALIFRSKRMENNRYPSYFENTQDKEYICIVPTKYNPYESSDSNIYRVIPGVFKLEPTDAQNLETEAMEKVPNLMYKMKCAIEISEVYCLL